MKRYLISVSAAVLVAGCATMSDDGAMQTDRSAMAMGESGAMAMSESAKTYVGTVHSTGFFEIESSRLALQKSRNDMVRSFAQMMIPDHSRMMQEMVAMDPSTATMPMMPMHAQMLQRLQAAPAESFDAMYHQEQMMAHQEALNMHRTYAANGDNQALRAMAAKAVPMVEMHRTHLETHRPHMTMQAPAGMPQQTNQPAPMTEIRSGERG